VAHRGELRGPLAVTNPCSAIRCPAQSRPSTRPSPIQRWALAELEIRRSSDALIQTIHGEPRPDRSTRRWRWQHRADSARQTYYWDTTSRGFKRDQHLRERRFTYRCDEKQYTRSGRVPEPGLPITGVPGKNRPCGRDQTARGKSSDPLFSERRKRLESEDPSVDLVNRSRVSTAPRQLHARTNSMRRINGDHRRTARFSAEKNGGPIRASCVRRSTAADLAVTTLVVFNSPAVPQNVANLRCDEEIRGRELAGN